MENSATADLTLSRENPSAVLKFSMENQITHDLKLTMDRTNTSTVVASTNELVKLSVIINKENSDSTSVTMLETRGTRRKLLETDSELMEILVNNHMHCFGYMVATVIIAAAIALSKGRIGTLMHFFLGGVFVSSSFAFLTNFILICFHPSHERDRIDRTRRWCRERVLVKCFLMLHWNTCFRVRNLLARMKEEDDDAATRVKEEEKNAHPLDRFDTSN